MARDPLPKGVNPGGPDKRYKSGTGQHRHDGGQQVTREEIRRRGRGRGYRWRTRRYGQAEKRPADYQIDPAIYSTGPGRAEVYHYHRQYTYHDQYAEQLAAAQSPPPQHKPQKRGWLQ